MATLTKIPLSGATYGAPIAVAATSIGSGTTIHTANSVTGAGQGDEVVLYAANVDTASHTLTLGIAGTATANQVVFVIAAQTTTQVLPGHLLANSQVVYAAADTANKINLFGYVLRGV